MTIRLALLAHLSACQKLNRVSSVQLHRSVHDLSSGDCGNASSRQFLDASSNSFTSHSTSASCTFGVIVVYAIYRLLTNLLQRIVWLSIICTAGILYCSQFFTL